MNQELTSPSPAERPTVQMDSDPIQVEHLSKYYGAFSAVEDVCFSVPKGAITAFLGPNGAGKSTVMRMLTGFLAPSRGRALINGYDMAVDRIAASHALGYLPENGPLYREMTPSGFLRFIGQARCMATVALAQALQHVRELCQLGEVWNKPIGKLSKGFRQRVGLAQAILHDPQVLVLDEPTSGLDPNQIRMVRSLIRELAKTKTILLSTHILQEVEAMSDRLLIIHEGRLVFQGTAQELTVGSSLEDRFHALTKGVAA